MRAVVLIFLFACAGSRARVAAKADPAAAQAQGSGRKPDQPAALPLGPGGQSCVDLLGRERALPESQQLMLAHDRALLAALAQCERFLMDRGRQKLKQATAESQPLYALAPEALSELPEQEVHSYIALLNRFALIGDLRRQLYYSPRLRAWFDRIAEQKTCTDPVREAWLYFSSTPESLGGNAGLGATLAARCP